MLRPSIPLNFVYGALAVLATLAGRPAASAELPDRDVQRLRVPEGGVQPQAVVDDAGTVHLVFLKGEPGGCDVLYGRLEPGKSEFSPPIRVNSWPGTAIAIGTIRGAQLALGRNGRVHVAWNGSDKAPKNPFGGTPMLYCRSDPQGRSFEPERNVMQRTSMLDGGGTVAADKAGNVFVAWHARSEDSVDGEMGRAMWVARSTNDGATFAPEAPAYADQTGACACCGTKAFADRRGDLYMLYRTATNGTARDMYLLTSRNQGARFEGRTIHPWRNEGCPMSSESLAEGPAGVLAAWEIKSKVYFARIDPSSSQLSTPICAPGEGDRKHPSIAANTRGETILAWAEGTGWQKGGALAWQVFDRDGKPTTAKGRVADGIPVWSLPTAVARPDGSFLIIH